MGIKGRRFVIAVAVIAAALGAAMPAMAQHSGGGGGHGGGGGGHAGGGAHFGGGAGRSAGAHFAAGAHYGAVGARYTGTRGYVGGVHSVTPGYGARPAYGYPGGGFYNHGYSTGAYWGGGYWRGGYWPRAYYGYGYSWFLPVLPLAYATYWYGGIPYYYANDVYYTWNPDYSGYTATDPPPVAGSTSADAAGSAAPPADAAGAGAAAPGAAMDPGAGAGAQIFMYPKNGQSQEQQSSDKRECQQWAAGQAGASNSEDYRRAMMACVEGRGYSAQ